MTLDDDECFDAGFASGKRAAFREAAEIVSQLSGGGGASGSYGFSSCRKQAVAALRAKAEETAS